MNRNVIVLMTVIGTASVLAPLRAAHALSGLDTPLGRAAVRDGKMKKYTRMLGLG